ncbi:hypothetical protein DVH24_026193 [Malus domestica]|uniref:Uncharacterized protein n=1 Tax=Malus domestica TaxID=3750 RepID=A0A498KHY9_MALDO|nr:hypothetical protein DVH24_026193 [Malus domestica]
MMPDKVSLQLHNTIFGTLKDLFDFPTKLKSKNVERYHNHHKLSTFHLVQFAKYKEPNKTGMGMARHDTQLKSVDVLHDILGGELGTLVLVCGGAALGLAVEQRLAVLVQPELGDDHLGWVDSDVHGGAIDLLAGDSFDVDDPFAAVDLDDLALAALEGPADHLDLVVLAHRHGSDVVLGTEVGGERGAHQHAAHAGRRGEVSLAVLPPGAGDAGIVLHLCSRSPRVSARVFWLPQLL